MRISKWLTKSLVGMAFWLLAGFLGVWIGWQVGNQEGRSQAVAQDLPVTSAQAVFQFTGASADQPANEQPADLRSAAEQAVSALKGLGATVKTDAQGRVVLVDLSGDKASDQAAKHLAPLRQLRSLRWSGPLVTDAAAEILADLPNLKVLKLDESRITDAGLARLKHLAQLEELYLARTPITDAGLEHVGQMLRLRRLRLSETKITGAGLPKLADLKELLELDVSRTALDDAALTALTKLPKLTRLNLYTTPITDAGLEQLAQMVQLTWLNLDNTQVTDAGLPKLRSLKKLEFLHLGRTRITDAGLAPLAELKQLKTLHLTNTGVTAEGAAKLQKLLPDCKILVGATEQSKPTEPPKLPERGASAQQAKSAELPSEPAKSTPSSQLPSGASGSDAEQPKPSAAQGVQVRLECTVRKYDPAKPDGFLIGLIENLSDQPVEVPASYESQRLLLWAKADEHPMPSAYWDRSRQKPDIPLVRLAPGQKQEVFRWPLQEVLADRHLTWRADYEAGKRFLVWDWQHHAHPPYSPIYQVGRTSFVPKADFWLELKLDGQSIRSEKITLEVKTSSAPDRSSSIGETPH